MSSELMKQLIWAGAVHWGIVAANVARPRRLRVGDRLVEVPQFLRPDLLCAWALRRDCGGAVCRALLRVRAGPCGSEFAGTISKARSSRNSGCRELCSTSFITTAGCGARIGGSTCLMWGV